MMDVMCLENCVRRVQQQYMFSTFSAELQNIKNQLCRHTGKKDREELPLGLSNDGEERRSGRGCSLSFVQFDVKSYVVNLMLSLLLFSRTDLAEVYATYTIYQRCCIDP